MKLKDAHADAMQATADAGVHPAPMDPYAGVPMGLLDRPFMRPSEVQRATTLDLKTIMRKVAAGDFPPPVRLAERRRAWRTKEVQRWIDDPLAYDGGF